MLAMTENILLNFEEIDSMSRPELNKLKALTTAETFTVRRPYAEHAEVLPHVASFCATGNNMQFLNDDTGNRRWLPFLVNCIDDPWRTPIPHDGIFAQLKALYDSGERYWFTQKEIDDINRRNRRFEAPNEAREMVLTHYRCPLPYEPRLNLTATDIASRLPLNMRISPAQIGKALTDLNFKKHRTRNGTFWEVVERTYDEINHTLPETVEE